MNAILQNYLYTFLHPFKVHEGLRRGKGGLKLGEAIAVSWLFRLPEAFYALITVHLGIQAWHSLHGVSASFDGPGQRYLLLKILLGIIFFPLGAWLRVKFWALIIRVFAILFERNPGESRRVAEEISRNALASHTLRIIPIFGTLADAVASLVLIFAGLRRNLLLSVPQALMVLCAPSLLLLGAGFLLFLSFAMLFIG